MHTPNHFKNNLKTIRATEIVRSARIKCLEVLFQTPTRITAQILFNIDTQGTQHSHDTRQRDQLRVEFIYFSQPWRIQAHLTYYIK